MSKTIRYALAALTFLCSAMAETLAQNPPSEQETTTTAQPKTYSIEDIIEELDDAQRETMAAVAVLNKYGFAAQAAILIEQLLPSLKEPAPFLVLLGEAHEFNGNLPSAITAYQSAVQLLAGKPNEFPVNLRFKLGSVLARADRCAAAIDELTLALEHPNAQRGSTNILLEMGACATRLGKDDLAVAAFDAALFQTPDNTRLWDARRAISVRYAPGQPPWPMPFAARLPPERMAWDAVLAIPAASRWQEEALGTNAEQYIQYAQSLFDSGHTEEAARFVTAVGRRVFGQAIRNLAKSNHEDAVAEVAEQINNAKGQLPADVLAFGHLLEMRAYGAMSMLLHSVAGLEQAYEQAQILKSEVISAKIAVQRTAFAWVSFDPGSGHARTKDPDGFIELSQLEDMASGAGPQTGSGTPGQGPHSEHEHDHHYSMTSTSEDWANVATASFMANQDKKMKSALIEHLSNLISRKKFELPIKFRLHMTAGEIMTQPLNDAGDTLQALLSTEITNLAATGSPIPEHLTIGYEIANRLERIQ